MSPAGGGWPYVVKAYPFVRRLGSGAHWVGLSRLDRTRSIKAGVGSGRLGLAEHALTSATGMLVSSFTSPLSARGRPVGQSAECTVSLSRLDIRLLMPTLVRSADCIEPCCQHGRGHQTSTPVAREPADSRAPGRRRAVRSACQACTSGLSVTWDSRTKVPLDEANIVRIEQAALTLGKAQCRSM